MLEDIYAGLIKHKAGIDLALGLLGVLAIFYAGRQLSENEKQRGITESFNLVEKIDDRLQLWSTETRRDTLDEYNFTRALASLFVSFEITAEAINRRYLSKMARELLTNQIIDSLPNIFGHDYTRDRFQYICHTEAICKAFKIFLLNNHKAVVRLLHHKIIIDSVYGPNNQSLFADGLVSFLERVVRRLRLRFAQ